MRKTYPLNLDEAEVRLLDGIIVAGMAVTAGLKADHLSSFEAASVITTANKYHDDRTQGITEEQLALFLGKYHAVTAHRDADEEMGFLDVVPESRLPSRLRMEYDEDEAIFLASMISFCSFSLGSGSTQSDQMLSYMSMRNHAVRLGKERINIMLSRFMSAVKTALPEVDFVSL